jgi:hypothetical protein
MLVVGGVPTTSEDDPVLQWNFSPYPSEVSLESWSSATSPFKQGPFLPPILGLDEIQVLQFLGCFPFPD